MLKKIVVAATLSLLATSAMAYQAWSYKFMDKWAVKPALGFDVGRGHQLFQDNYGKETFRRNYPATNLYLNTRIGDYFGIEAGYEHLHRQMKNQFYAEDAPVLGFLSDQPTGRLTLANLFAQGGYVSAVGYLPLRDKTDVFAHVGANWRRFYYEVTAVADVQTSGPIVNWESSHRTSVRWGFGLAQMFTENLGGRLQINWEQSHRQNKSVAVPVALTGSLSPSAQTDFFTVKPKHTCLIMLGMFYSFA